MLGEQAPYSTRNTRNPNHWKFPACSWFTCVWASGEECALDSLAVVHRVNIPYIFIYIYSMHNILNWALNWEVDEKWDDGFWCILLQPQPATRFHGSEVLSCWGLRHHPPRPGRQVDWLSSPGLPCNNDVLVLHSPQNWHKSAETQKSENLEGSHFGAIRVYLPQVHEACDSQRFRFRMLDGWSVGKRCPSTEVSRTCGSNGWSPLLA